MSEERIDEERLDSELDRDNEDRDDNPWDERSVEKSKDRDNNSWDRLDEYDKEMYKDSTKSGEPWDTPVDRGFGYQNLVKSIMDGESLMEEYQIPLFPLSQDEKQFGELRVSGYTLEDAYIQAFGKTDKKTRKPLKSSTMVARARTLEKKPYMVAYKQYVESKLDLMFVERAMWSREDSTRALRNLIQAAEEEIQDNNTALEMRLALIKESVEEGLWDERKAMEETAKLLAGRRLSKNTQAAITESVKELNAMFGFDGEGLRQSDAVTFVDSEIIED